MQYSAQPSHNIVTVAAIQGAGSWGAQAWALGERVCGKRWACLGARAGAAGARAQGAAAGWARGRVSGRAAGRAGAWLGARRAQGTTSRQYRRAAYARRLGQLGQVGVLCTPTQFLDPVRLSIFPESQNEHCSL